MCCFLAALAAEHISIAGHSAAMEKSFFSALSVRSVRQLVSRRDRRVRRVRRA